MSLCLERPLALNEHRATSGSYVQVDLLLTCLIRQRCTLKCNLPYIAIYLIHSVSDSLPQSVVFHKVPNRDREKCYPHLARKANLGSAH